MFGLLHKVSALRQIYSSPSCFREVKNAKFVGLCPWKLSVHPTQTAKIYHLFEITKYSVNYGSQLSISLCNYSLL